jgi:hypothetical protein
LALQGHTLGPAQTPLGQCESRQHCPLVGRGLHTPTVVGEQVPRMHSSPALQLLSDVQQPNGAGTTQTLPQERGIRAIQDRHQRRQNIFYRTQSVKADNADSVYSRPLSKYSK